MHTNRKQKPGIDGTEMPTTGIRFTDVEDERTTSTHTEADLPEGMDEADAKEKENAPG